MTGKGCKDTNGERVFQVFGCLSFFVSNFYILFCVVFCCKEIKGINQFLFFWLQSFMDPVLYTNLMQKTIFALSGLMFDTAINELEY